MICVFEGLVVFVRTTVFASASKVLLLLAKLIVHLLLDTARPGQIGRHHR